MLPGDAFSGKKWYIETGLEIHRCREFLRALAAPEAPLRVCERRLSLASRANVKIH